MDSQHNQRHNDELTIRICHLLDYFDSHKETIIAGMTGGVRLRELIAACVIFGSIMMGMNVYLLEQHAARPHPEAVHKDDFNRATDNTTAALHRLEEKMDRMIASHPH